MVEFLEPIRLWLAVPVAALVILYIWRQRRRRVWALRFTRVALLDSVAPSRPRWRRHLPAVGFLLVALVLVVAAARPAGHTKVPRELASVVVTIDVSMSMMADDVRPSRLAAAQEAAAGFVDDLPASINVGLVSFAGTASVLVPPTTDRTRIKQAISRLRLAESTAIGEGILVSLEGLRQGPVSSADTPVPQRIVLLSDGESTVGRSNTEAIKAAKAASVQVSTIAFGTSAGSVTIGGKKIPVPVGERDLQQIAEGTNGKMYKAGSLSQLKEAYRDIGSSVGFVTETREVTDLWAIGGLLLLLLVGALATSVWGRVP